MIVPVSSTCNPGTYSAAEKATKTLSILGEVVIRGHAALLSLYPIRVGDQSGTPPYPFGSPRPCGANHLQGLVYLWTLARREISEVSQKFIQLRRLNSRTPKRFGRSISGSVAHWNIKLSTTIASQ